MVAKKKIRTGARRQQQRKGRELVVSNLTLLLVFFKTVLFWSILMAALVYGWRQYQFLRTPDAQPFNQIEVIGEFKNLEQNLFRQQVQEVLDGGYFSLELASLKNTLEKEPWVYRVDVERQWPDTLLVRVEEQVPIAFWGEGAYLNQYGVPFALTGVRVKQNLPHINGSNGREKALIQNFLEYDQILNQVGLALVQLSEDARHDQRLLLGDGTIIALGRNQRMARMTRFAGIYKNQLSGVATNIASLDLRYNHGFTVSWIAPRELAGSNHKKVEKGQKSG